MRQPTANIQRLLAVAGIVGLSATAMAQSVETETVTVTPSIAGTTFDLGNTVTFSVPQFDPSLGTLNSVDLTLTPTFGDFGSQAINFSASPLPANGFSVSNPYGSLVDSALGLNATWSSSDSKPSPNYIAGPSGTTDGPALAFTFTATPSSVTGISPAGFVGVGDDNLVFDGNATATSSGSGNPFASFYGNVGGTLAVDFNYTAVPEPSTLALLLPFAAGALGVLRKSRSV